LLRAHTIYGETSKFAEKNDRKSAITVEVSSMRQGQIWQQSEHKNYFLYLVLVEKSFPGIDPDPDFPQNPVSIAPP
jgi:hypothetical protein